MANTEKQRQLKADMVAEVQDLIGSGYIPEYYEGIAEPFIEIAEWYAKMVRREERDD